MAVSVAVVYGFARVFATWSFFWPMVAIAIYSHLAAMLLRRRGWGVGASAAAAALGFAALATWLWFASTTFLGVPTGRTLDALSAELDASWIAFQEMSAPVPVLTGFLVAAALALFAAAFLADWAAFRLWSPVEALVPATTLFVFCTLLGSDVQGMPSAVLFAASAIVFLLVHRVARLEGGSGWLTSDVEPGGQALVRLGLALAVVAVLAGAIVGPRLPGADQGPLLDLGQGVGPAGSRVTVSPLVDIRSRLVEQSRTVVFRVTAEAPRYWRLTSLDTFDGEIWRSGGRYAEVSGLLASADRVPTGTPTLVQEFEIEALESLWLPAAFEPVEIRADESVRYQEESATLIVDTEFPTSDGFEYSVRSTVPGLTPEELRAASASGVPPELLEVHAADPPGLSGQARALAREVTSDATSSYDKAIALQDWFRTNFVYDLETTDAGHGVNAIDAFLASGRGYCEQFAGTFAAMARSLGIPARVAVGFTPGDPEQLPDGRTRYRVEGRHAHAWAEVYFGGVGWVPFEPTPGRGEPGMEPFNGVPPAQDTGLPSSATTLDPTTTTTLAAGSPEVDPGALAGLLAQGEPPDATPADAGGWDGLGVIGQAGVALAALLAGVGAYVALAWGVHASRRRRRAACAVDPGGRVREAWTTSVEELGLVGAVRMPQETHDEFAHRAADVVPDRAGDLAVLATDTDVATFAPDIVDEEMAGRSEEAAERISAHVRSRVPRWRVALLTLDPRRLAGQTRGPRRQAHGSRG